jgi:lipoprotein-anchoring transpeptidase ErfK/SrfK
MNTILKTAAAIAALIVATTLPASANQFFLFGPVQTAPAPSIAQQEAIEERAEVPARFRRQIVNYPTNEPAGTIIVDTLNTYLYLVLGNGRAMRYGIGVGRDGFTWSGVQSITRRAEWPDWHPPAEMIARQPYLPRYMAGGPGNPMGARALYLGNTIYRIHGTNAPHTIGQRVSSGCIRMTNEDVTDLYSRVNVGTRVVVLPQTGRHASSSNRPVH